MANNTARYADIFAALGSEPRLDIIRLLFAIYPDGMTVGELQAQLKIPNSTLSHHLEKLRVEGLVNSRRDRQFRWYSVKAETIEDLLSFLYNGCSMSVGISEAQAQPPEEYYAVELVQVTSSPKKEGFMFERFLQSIHSFFEGLSVPERFVMPSGFERFTQKAIQAIFLAQDESRRLQHRYVGTEQILLGLLTEGTGMAAEVLTTAGVDLEAAQLQVEQKIGRGRGTPADIPFTPRAKQALELTVEQAQQLGHRSISTEHLLLGLLCEGQGLAIRVLENLGVSPQNLEQQLRAAMNS